MALPNRISYLRKKRGLSMQKLAHAAGTSQQQIDRLEKGQRRLTVEWMQRLSEALDCSIVDLLPETQKDRDYAVTAKAKVIGAIDAENSGQLLEFEENEVYTVIFGRPRNITNPRLFSLVIRGEGLGFSDGDELVLAEMDRNQKLPEGKKVLCAERSGQYLLRETPVASKDEIIKAVVVKAIKNV